MYQRHPPEVLSFSIWISAPSPGPAVRMRRRGWAQRGQNSFKPRPWFRLRWQSHRLLFLPRLIFVSWQTPTRPRLSCLFKSRSHTTRQGAAFSRISAHPVATLAPKNWRGSHPARFRGCRNPNKGGNPTAKGARPRCATAGRGNGRTAATARCDTAKTQKPERARRPAGKAALYLRTTLTWEVPIVQLLGRIGQLSKALQVKTNWFFSAFLERQENNTQELRMNFWEGGNDAPVTCPLLPVRAE